MQLVERTTSTPAVNILKLEETTFLLFEALSSSVPCNIRHQINIPSSSVADRKLIYRHLVMWVVYRILDIDHALIHTNCDRQDSALHLKPMQAVHYAYSIVAGNRLPV